MYSVEIPTQESIQIKLHDSWGDVIIQVDGCDYAILPDCDIKDLDLNEVGRWVDETYYEAPYTDEQYIVPRLSSESFQVKEEKDA